MSSLESQLRQEYIKIGKKAKYGTAGFRDLASNIPYIVYKVGAFVSILNRIQPTKCLGVVMSASHNKIQDNGLKITNFNGNMLQMEYQPILQSFVDNQSLQAAVNDLKTYLASKGRKISDVNATIFIGGDTRPSTPKLLDILSQGIKSQNGTVVNFQLTTTPQLQYYVYLYNNVFKTNTAPKNVDIQKMRPFFWKNFCQYFDKSAKYLNWNTCENRTIDCANGIGGRIMPQFNKLLKGYFNISLINISKDQYLNKGCGADYVKVDGKFPSEYKAQQHNSFITYDGDADRILLFSEKDNQLQLIDGDRQGTILTEFFKKTSTQVSNYTNKLKQSQKTQFSFSEPTIGFVQTYYANYSSSQYLQRKYQMKPVFAATGVKHLHQKAQHYDIGIYYEANGHGTVIFSEDFLHRTEKLLSSIQSKIETEQNEKSKSQLQQYFQLVKFYYNSCKLANPSVGDAITNFLLVEIAMKYLKMTYTSAMGLYTDLKSKTSKVQVGKKENLKVTEIQDKVVEPSDLQRKIEEILAEFDGKKAFLRASGTQNVLRLHVEADTREKVQQITAKVYELVHKTVQLN